MLKSFPREFLCGFCVSCAAIVLMCTQLFSCDIDKLAGTVVSKEIEVEGNMITCMNCNNFGRMITIQGDIMAISDNYNLFLFERRAGNWVQVQKMDYWDGTSFSMYRFIRNIYLFSPTQLFVGAAADRWGNGRVEVYERSNSGSIWAKVQTVERKKNSDKFGESFHLMGDRMIVGAPDPANLDIGRVFVYTKQNSQWVLESELISPTSAPDDGFGASVHFVGDYALVTNSFLDKPVQVFKRNGSSWSFDRFLSVKGITLAGFGNEIMVAGNQLTALKLEEATQEFIPMAIEVVDELIPDNLFHGESDYEIERWDRQPVEMYGGFALVTSYHGKTVLFKLAGNTWKLERVFDQNAIGLSITDEFFALAEADQVVTLIPR